VELVTAGRAFSAAIEQLPLRRNVVAPKPLLRDGRCEVRARPADDAGERAAGWASALVNVTPADNGFSTVGSSQ
jgi:hypothetical protein